MANRLTLIASLAFLFLFTGCVTPTTMAYSEGAKAPLIKGNAVFLMTVSQKNTDKTSHHPKLNLVYVEKTVVKDKEDRFNFVMNDEGKSESEEAVGNHYLVRMELANGKYVLRGLRSLNQAFLLNGTFFAPLHAPLEAAGPGVFYLGHISATVRKRKKDEFKAGIVVPLIDQAVVGAAGGTFDIEISDQWEADQARFIAQFPALKGIEVKKMLLPPFDRERAQTYWEEN